MAGAGNRRDEGSLPIKNTNVFAALETLKKKKKSDKDRGSSKTKGFSKSQAKEPEPQVIWTPAPLTVKSWADVDDEDDDDYYATTAPPQSVWGVSESYETKEEEAPIEESESEEEVLDEEDEEVEDEHDEEPKEPIQPEHLVKKAPEVSSALREPERQLSKKEKKKKELAELDALLADFGVSAKVDNTQNESPDVSKEMKDGVKNATVDGENEETASMESKSAKKKKKKDKSSKDVKEPQDQPNNSDVSNGPEEESAIDVKERLKKVASLKKKKYTKELAAAARAATTEAAVRREKLAAAKKKEKSHYNQQPVR